MDDVSSKLLLVPESGLPAAEAAAKDLHVPIASIGVTFSSGT